MYISTAYTTCRYISHSPIIMVQVIRCIPNCIIIRVYVQMCKCTCISVVMQHKKSHSDSLVRAVHLAQSVEGQGFESLSGHIFCILFRNV